MFFRMFMVEYACELTTNEFNEFIREGLVLIDFFADWCMPCMMMLPIIEDVAKEFEGKIKIAKLNAGEYPEIADKYGVNSIPNFTIFKDGQVLEQFTGAVSQDELEEKLSSYLEDSKLEKSE